MQREFIFTDKWSDLVFENRNQSYGAYVLRKLLPRNILIGYLTAVILMGTVVFTIFQFSKISAEVVKGIIDELPPQIIYEIPQVTPPTPPKSTNEIKTPPSKTSAENIIPIIKDSVNDAEPKKEILKSNDTNNLIDSSALSDNGNEKNSAGSQIKKSAESTEPIAPYMADKMPEFPGGEIPMINFIHNNVHYPREYLNDEITGTVFISFVVDSTGKIYQVKSEKNADGYYQFTDEAIKAVSKMPRWIPGQQHGRNVAVRMTLPVKFSLKKN